MNLRDLRQYLKALRRRALLIILLAISFGGYTLYTTLKTTPVYTASALILISPSTAYLGADAITQKLVKTYTLLMTKRPLLEYVIQNLKLDVDPDYLAGKISVQTVPGTLFMTISVTDTSPTVAQTVANEVSIDIVQPDKVPWSEPTKVYLKLFLQTNNLVLVEPAEEPPPTAGGRSRSVLLAGGVGLLLGVGLAFLLEALDNGIKRPEDVENQIELAVLGSIPPKTLTPSLLADGAEAIPEDVRNSLRAMARRILLRSQDKPVRSILITSASPLEGKSLSAAYLAIGFALEGNRTTLVDGNVERPVLHMIFGVDNDAGLMDVLKDQTPPAELLRPTTIENLSLMTSGPIPANPSGMLVPERVGAFLDALYQETDVVVIDTGALSTGTEVEPLALAADRVLMVVRANKTRKELAQRGRDVLVDRGADLFGAIFNPHTEIISKPAKKSGTRSSK